MAAKIDYSDPLLFSGFLVVLAATVPVIGNALDVMLHVASSQPDEGPQGGRGGGSHSCAVLSHVDE